MYSRKFETEEQIHQYLEGEKIQCLECGKWFLSFSTHLPRMHGMSANDYRDKYDLPRSTPLAGQSTRQTLSSQMLAMREEGIVNDDHLAEAARKIDYSKMAAKKQVSVAKQKAATSKARWGKNRYKPGAKNETGKDMDRRREYQRAYRALMKGDSAPMRRYREKHAPA